MRVALSARNAADSVVVVTGGFVVVVTGGLVVVVTRGLVVVVTRGLVVVVTRGLVVVVTEAFVVVAGGSVVVVAWLVVVVVMAGAATGSSSDWVWRKAKAPPPASATSSKRTATIRPLRRVGLSAGGSPLGWRADWTTLSICAGWTMTVAPSGRSGMGGRSSWPLDEKNVNSSWMDGRSPGSRCRQRLSAVVSGSVMPSRSASRFEMRYMTASGRPSPKACRPVAA